MRRKCPKCGAVVPDNSLTCPQCYTEVPRDLVETEPLHDRNEFREQIERRKKNMKISLALAVIPAFFGILGIGLIYQDSRDYRGWQFLAIGAILYLLPVVTLVTIGFASVIGAVLLIIPVFFALLLYAGAALASIAETYFGSFRLLFK